MGPDRELLDRRRVDPADLHGAHDHVRELHRRKLLSGQLAVAGELVAEGDHQETVDEGTLPDLLLASFEHQPLELPVVLPGLPVDQRGRRLTVAGHQRLAVGLEGRADSRLRVARPGRCLRGSRQAQQGRQYGPGEARAGELHAICP